MVSTYMQRSGNECLANVATAKKKLTFSNKIWSDRVGRPFQAAPIPVFVIGGGDGCIGGLFLSHTTAIQFLSLYFGWYAGPDVIYFNQELF